MNAAVNGGIVGLVGTLPASPFAGAVDLVASGASTRMRYGSFSASRYNTRL